MAGLVGGSLTRSDRLNQSRAPQETERSRVIGKLVGSLEGWDEPDGDGLHMRHTAPAVMSEREAPPLVLPLAPWHELFDVRHCGGKALHLAELLVLAQRQRRGGPSGERVRVPAGAVLTTLAYDEHVHRARLDERLARLLGGADVPESELEAVRAALTATACSRQVTGQVRQFLAGLPAEVQSVAVRSSSTMEDAGDCSYAGQYETFLNVSRDVDAVLAAVRRCWASVWEGRLLAYRRSVGVPPSDVPSMAVVIMEMLRPSAAGVVFALNPVSGDCGEVLVEAVHGLGEGLVGGQCTPHSWTVLWRTGEVVRDRPVVQEKKYAPAEGPAGGVHLVDTTVEEQAAPPLSAAHRSALVSLAQGISAFFGTPNDLEFAVQDGQVYMLQARPITAYATVTADDTFYYAGFANACMATLSLSATAYADCMREVLGGGGREERLVCTRYGHAYINARLWRKYLDKSGRRPVGDLVAELRAAVLASQAEGETLRMRTPLSLRALLVFQRYANALSFRLGDAVEVAMGVVERFPHAPSLVALVDGVNPKSEANFSAQVLVCLARQVAQVPALVSHFAAHNPTPSYDAFNAACRAAGDPGARCLQLFDQTVRRFSFMSGRDEDMGGVRWGDDPQAPLAMLAVMARNAPPDTNSFDPDAVQTLLDEPLCQVRTVDTTVFHTELARVSELLGQDDGARAAWGEAVRVLRELLHLKEVIHIVYTLNNHALRQAMVQFVKQKLGEKGPVTEHHPIFNLTFEELHALPDTPLADIPALLQVCDTYANMYKLFSPPNYISKRSRKVEGAGKEGESGGAKASASYSGTGCSAGVVSGRAVRLDSVNDVHRLETGGNNILVTRYTDPSWTPIFSQVVAVVLQDGGVLSHAGVVAREMGIPAVVGCPNCISIPHGSKIRVDGQSGLVEIL